MIEDFDPLCLMIPFLVCIFHVLSHLIYLLFTFDTYLLMFDGHRG